jgi:hypothetical protein
MLRGPSSGKVAQPATNTPMSRLVQSRILLSGLRAFSLASMALQHLGTSMPQFKHGRVAASAICLAEAEARLL